MSAINYGVCLIKHPKTGDVCRAFLDGNKILIDGQEFDISKIEIIENKIRDPGWYWLKDDHVYPSKIVHFEIKKWTELGWENPFNFSQGLYGYMGEKYSISDPFGLIVIEERIKEPNI